MAIVLTTQALEPFRDGHLQSEDNSSLPGWLAGRVAMKSGRRPAPRRIDPGEVVGAGTLRMSEIVKRQSFAMKRKSKPAGCPVILSTKHLEI